MLVTLVGIAVVFGLVIAAWKSGDDSQNTNAADRRHRAARTGRARAGRARHPRCDADGGASQLAGRRARLLRHDSERARAVVQDRAEALAVRAASCGRRPGRQRALQRAHRHACSSSTPRASSARPPRIDAPAGAPRRHRQRARPRRADRSERPVPRAGDARARARAGADHDRRRRRARSSRRRCGKGSPPDLLVTSGGLGPTHDDRTVELLARVTGRELRVDDDLHGKIERVSRGVAERLRRPYADFEPGVRKQASVPDGAASVGLAGTAPGLVLEHRGTVVVVLPGPPGELQRLWASAVKSEPMLRVARASAASRAAGAPALRRERVRRRARARGGRRRARGVEATICARDFEIHVDLVVDPARRARRTRSSPRSPARSSAGCSPATSGRSRSTCSRSAARAG